MADFRAAERFLNLFRANQVPAGIRQDAAAGKLSLPFADRLVILVDLAQAAEDLKESATATLRQLNPDAVAEVLADPACPDQVLEWFASGGAVPESASGQPFELAHASEDERAAMHTPAPPRPGEGLLVRLARMNPPQRVQAALRGGRDERLLLIRDSNRVVWRAVLESPRLSESDVELIAAMRNVHEDVLRHVAGQRRFLRSLTIIRNLVNNPRTPQDVSLALLKHLFSFDLHFVERNRMISEVVRRQAAKLLQQKQTS